jgi:hypothetical protein
MVAGAEPDELFDFGRRLRVAGEGSGEEVDLDGFVGDGGGGEVGGEISEGADLAVDELFGEFAEEALLGGFAGFLDAAGEDEEGGGVFFPAEEDALITDGKESCFFEIGHEGIIRAWRFWCCGWWR